MICEICGGSSFKKTPFFYDWNGKKFDLVKCKSCGLITQDPKPNDAELESLYSGDYFESGAHGLNQIDESYEQHRDKISAEHWKQRIQEYILNYKSDTKNIFEIGFAMGHLLVAAKDMGITVSGIEFSDAAIQKAREKFGLDVYQGNFENFDTQNHMEKWDCMYGGDVFEHFTHPDKVCINMRAILKPDGIVVLIIPSTFNLFSTKLASLLYSISGKRKKMFDKPYHLYEYTTSTIRKIMEKHFEDVQIINKIKKPSELNMKSGSIEYKLKYLIHLINYPFTRIFNRNGDRILIIARKQAPASS